MESEAEGGMFLQGPRQDDPCMFLCHIRPSRADRQGHPTHYRAPVMYSHLSHVHLSTKAAVTLTTMRDGGWWWCGVVTMASNLLLLSLQPHISDPTQCAWSSKIQIVNLWVDLEVCVTYFEPWANQKAFKIQSATCRNGSSACMWVNMITLLLALTHVTQAYVMLWVQFTAVLFPE